jgi:hypothetical protein
MTALGTITSYGSEGIRSSLSAPCGSAAELRAFIGETIGLAAVHAGIAGTYASLANDKGLEYALRCFAASSKAALQTFTDLKAANIKGAADGRK